MKEPHITPYKEFTFDTKPYYEEVDGEAEAVLDAFACRRAVALVGPTGCGKTTLTSYIAALLHEKVQKEFGKDARYPYIEVCCHEDITERHLVGGIGAQGEWQAGPLYIGATAKYGALVVLDEFAEARPDARVLVHSLTDDQRVLPVPKKGEVVEPSENFQVIACYNPGYQIKAKALKPSTRQRFVTIEMDYPSPELETKIVVTKTGIEVPIAKKIVNLAYEIRQRAKGNDAFGNLQEGASTRLLVMAAEIYQMRLQQEKKKPDLERIARIAILNPITSEETDRKALEKMLQFL